MFIKYICNYESVLNLVQSREILITLFKLKHIQEKKCELNIHFLSKFKSHMLKLGGENKKKLMNLKILSNLKNILWLFKGEIKYWIIYNKNLVILSMCVFTHTFLCLWYVEKCRKKKFWKAFNNLPYVSRKRTLTHTDTFKYTNIFLLLRNSCYFFNIKRKFLEFQFTHTKILFHFKISSKI